jgi:hypothetical protein
VHPQQLAKGLGDLLCVDADGGVLGGQVLADRAGELGGLLEHLRPAVVPGLRHALDDLRERGPAERWRGREVRARIERFQARVVGRARAGRGQPDRHRPPARAGHELDRVHVNVVQVRSLLAVDLDADELLVQQGCDGGVLEGLALHHVAPVAGRVAHR